MHNFQWDSNPQSHLASCHKHPPWAAHGQRIRLSVRSNLIIYTYIFSAGYQCTLQISSTYRYILLLQTSEVYRHIILLRILIYVETIFCWKLALSTIHRFPTNINVNNPVYVLGRMITNSELEGLWHGVFLR